MTTAISNISAIWVDANAKIGIGFNVVNIGQNASSRLLSLKANSNTVFDVTTNGIVNANSFVGNTFTGNVVTANTVSYNLIQSKVYTVSTLPSASIGAGYRAFVSDANQVSFLANVFSGGANNVPVFSDGTRWKIG